MSLQKLLSNTRELDVSELDEVSGAAPLTITKYTDEHGVTHSVSVRDF